jgi:CheY-like chemotaxis protein
MTSRQLAILLIEDNEDDVYFMELALSRAHLEPPIHIADNGQDALDYLSGAGKYADRNVHPLPQCIFLDLKLPFIDGFEILEWIQGQPALRNIPVIILTSSPEEADRQRARQLGARAYPVKPPTPEMLLDALKASPGCLPESR